MLIETDKFIIKPLSPEELRLYIAGNGELESHLGLNIGVREVPEIVQKAITEKILPLLDNPECNYLFYTFWTVISREHNAMVADICFKGAPGAQGEVEIGYGTYPEYQGAGIMTETVKAIVNWAFSQGIKAVIAETDPVNIASHKVLQNNNFTLNSESPGNLKWQRLNISLLNPKQGNESEI